MLHWTTAVCLSLTINGCEKMPPTSTPRTAVHTSDLSPDDFALLAGKIVSKTGLAGPFQLTEGTIDDYENQSQKPELVWFGGTEEDPFCVWISYPGGSYLKIKWPTPSSVGFCQSVLDCLVADIERGAGTPDKYRIPEMTGPTWRIATVVYGDANTEVSFAADTGTDLASLVTALNDSDELPEDWYWEILTGALALCVPHGTDVTQVVLDGGTEVDFTAPTVTGTPASRVGGNLTITQVITGNGAAVGSAHDTEAEVEAQFSTMQNVTVRWTDALTHERVSYKDATNGWLHSHVKKFLPLTTPVSVLTSTPGASGGAKITVSSPPYGTYAVQVVVDVEFLATSGAARAALSAFPVGGNSATPGVKATIYTNDIEAQRDAATGPVPLDGSNQFAWYLDRTESAIIKIWITGYYVE